MAGGSIRVIFAPPLPIFAVSMTGEANGKGDLWGGMFLGS
jgi:hypothetical protein